VSSLDPKPNQFLPGFFHFIFEIRQDRRLAGDIKEFVWTLLN
jgi:hypothetical protein